jgi:hypothetical protein
VVNDTIKILDSIIYHDTIGHIDTLVKLDTLVDTITVSDTIVKYDTIQNTQQDYNGLWLGKTSQDTIISFIIDENGLDSIHIVYKTRSFTAGSKTKYTPPKESCILNDSLHIDNVSSKYDFNNNTHKKEGFIVSGKFQNSTLVGGTIRIKDSPVLGDIIVYFIAKKQ